MGLAGRHLGLAGLVAERLAPLLGGSPELLNFGIGDCLLITELTLEVVNEGIRLCGSGGMGYKGASSVSAGHYLHPFGPQR